MRPECWVMLSPKLRSARMGFSEVLQLRCKLRYWLLVMWCGRCAVFVWLFPVRHRSSVLMVELKNLKT